MPVGSLVSLLFSAYVISIIFILYTFQYKISVRSHQDLVISHLLLGDEDQTRDNPYKEKTEEKTYVLQNNKQPSS